ncbi:MAG: hypothetical protein AB1792_07915 [Candidatus Zixiibacteriota bacterium]
MVRPLSTVFRNAMAAGLALVLLGAGMAHAGNPNVVGTYRLVSRQLPDGTVKSEPDVTGILTFTNAHRNLNVIWKGPNDALCSYSLASRYQIKSGTLKEKILFSSLNDHLLGQKTGYDLVKKSQLVRIVTGQTASGFTPSIETPTMIVDGNRIISTAEGAFIDTWEKTEAGSAIQASDEQ